MKQTVTLIVALILSICSISAQTIKHIGTTYIKNFFPEDYNSSKQNWCAVQDFRGILYVANTQGVLEYDGVNWRSISTSKNSSALALALSNDKRRVYVGGNTDIGYLSPDSSGTMQYVSLFELLPERYRNIKVYGITVTENDEVLFCASSQLMLYANDTIKVIPLADGSTNVFSYITKHNGRVYVNQSDKGYCEFINRKEEPIIALEGTDTIHDNQVVSILGDKNGGMVLATKKLGISIYKNNRLIPLNIPINAKLVQSDLYCATQLKGGYYAFGTLKKGIIITDSNFNEINRFNQSFGLCSNQIINLYQSPEGGLWALTNNGIAYIDIYSPISTIHVGIKKVSAIGCVNDDIYIGASSLLRIHNKDLALGGDAFQSVAFPADKTQNTINSINTVDNQIICGTAKGVIGITPNGESYAAEKTTQVVRLVIQSEKRPDLLIGGCIGGISVYEKNPDGNWSKRQQSVTGFDVETRHIVEDPEGFFWVSKKETGLYKLILDSSYSKVITVKQYDQHDGLPSSMGNYVYKVGKDIIVATQQGFYAYDKLNDTFVKSEKYNALFDSEIEAYTIYQDQYGKIWINYLQTRKNAKSELCFGYFNGFDTTKQNTRLFVPFASKFKTVKDIADSCYLIGCDDELLHYDSKLQKYFDIPFKAFIRRMETITNDSLLFGGAYVTDEGDVDSLQTESLKITLPYDFNGVKFEFGANSYEYPEETKFKYFLEHNDAGWSDWKSENFKEFNNLSPGTYTFMVKARNIFGHESEVAHITFTVLPPWYMTIWTYILYVLAFAAVIWVIIKIYFRKLLKDKQRLEKIVSERTAEIVEKNKEITEKNKSITDSINYASRIQKAMLPLESRIQEAIPEHFILFRPRDIVSGDFYWFAETPDRIIITAADCTGHGVPGAFMSMVGVEILTTLVSKGIVESDNILTHQNRYIRKALNQDQTENHDGMDMALCSIDKKRNVVEFTGAKNPLIYIKSNGDLVTIKPDKQGIGGDQIEEDFHYTKNEIPVEPGTWYYMFSDGYQDQFGGPQHRKFMIKHMRELLLEIHTLPPQEQKERLNSTIEKWMADGGTEQTDDILVIGFKL